MEPSARIKDAWMYEQVERLDRTEGEIENLQHRLAEIRTWTYAANRTDWLENAETWRGRTREIEDKLSDALHQALMSRFVDRRTSALLKALNSDEDAPAEIGSSGEVLIGGHPVGHLEGLVFHAEAANRCAPSSNSASSPSSTRATPISASTRQRPQSFTPVRRSQSLSQPLTGIRQRSS
jgi:ATP-dependent RNA helicase SUPV3L1/SUV3